VQIELLDRPGHNLTEQDGQTRCLLSGGRYRDLYDGMEGAKPSGRFLRSSMFARRDSGLKERQASFC
jgi:hypothetical protein